MHRFEVEASPAKNSLFLIPLVSKQHHRRDDWEVVCELRDERMVVRRDIK